jgi:hypothetical protein
MNRSDMTIRWGYKGERYVSRVVGACVGCGAAAIVALPPAVRAEQPDDTTHVCHPVAGGCNRGYSDLPTPATIPAPTAEPMPAGDVDAVLSVLLADDFASPHDPARCGSYRVSEQVIVCPSCRRTIDTKTNREVEPPPEASADAPAADWDSYEPNTYGGS